MPQFMLYGLVGCPHCESAEKFLRARNIPTILVMANDDPVAHEGNLEVARQKIKANSKTEGKTEEEILQAISVAQAEYPLLVSRVTKEIISGFKEEDYARVASTYFALVSASAPSVFANQQQPQS